MKIYKKRSWHDWISGITDFHFCLALLCILLAVVITFVIHYDLIVQSNFFASECDTAGMHSAIVNTLHGQPFRDSAYDGPNILGRHSFFSLLFVVPIYALAPGVNTLFVLQIICVYSAIIPLYLIACHVLDNPRYSLIISGSIIPCGLLYAMATGPFHLETMITGAVLWSYYGYLKNNIVLAVVSMLFAFGCGEQSALIYIAMGLMISWKPSTRTPRHIGFIFGISGLAWVVFALFILPLLCRDPSQPNLFALNYKNWNIQSPLELPLNVLLSPGDAVTTLFNSARWYYVIGLVGLPILLSVLFMRTWPLLFPFIIYFLMSDDQFYLNLHSYYFQFGFIAGVIALMEVFQRFDLSSKVGILVLTATCASNMIGGSECYGVFMYAVLSADDFNQEVHAKFDDIPIDAAVYCPHRYSAYLSNHPDMVMGDLRDKDIDFDKMVEREFRSTQVHAADIQYLFADYITDQCGLRKESPELDYQQNRRENIAKLLKNGEWEQVWTKNDVVILHRIKGRE